MGKPVVSKHDIAQGLRELGIGPGDSVMVHSSLSSMGWVDRGADAVIDAFLELLGARGTLMAPTFTAIHALPEVFDPATVPSGMGRVTETLRLRPEAVRSLDPWHSVAAIGTSARFYTENHLHTTTMGFDSPLDRLAGRGGKVVLIGVGHNRNSMIHLGELRVPVPYLDVPYNEDYAKPRRIRLPDGTIGQKVPDEMPGCSDNFVVLEPIFRARGILRFGAIGQATVQAMVAMDIIDAVVEEVRGKPDLLLCDNPSCCFCPNARGRMAPRG